MRAVRWLQLSSLFLAASLGCSSPTTHAEPPRPDGTVDATHLPTGVRLDPGGPSITVGPMPLSMAAAPGGRFVAVLLNGWARTGVQIVDWRAGRVMQTLDLPAAFLGLAFSPDGNWLCASGGVTDRIYLFRWTGASAVLEDSIALEHGSMRPGARYPAQLAFSNDGHRLYVAENLSDSLAVIDMDARRTVQRVPAGRYPYGVVVGANGTVYVSAWGGASVSAFATRGDSLLRIGIVPAGRHPSAMMVNRTGTRLFVASASTDRIRVIDTRTLSRIRDLRDDPPGGVTESSTPNALALSADESRLYVAEADANAVAAFALSSVTADVPTTGDDSLTARVPSGWYPSALIMLNGTLLVANGKGRGTRANPDGPGPHLSRVQQASGKNSTLGQLTGSITLLDTQSFAGDAGAAMSRRVASANGWNAATPARRYPPFEHVVYVIRENRTYDQVLGDLPTTDGDTSLTYFGRDVTPNAHALAERFGAFDRFFVNAEVSADGHNWTVGAYATDYVEKTVQPNYSGRGRSYDYEGSNRGVIPDDDVNEPSAGYLWTQALRHGVSVRNYGEFVVPSVDHASYRATKAELQPSTHPQFPGFNLDIPDQHRADIWLAELESYVQRGAMPALEIVRLPNDHTSGAAADKPTPRAAVADNDLALGRMIAGLSRTAFWKSTVVFVVEDDAQNGPDHVDSHRSVFLAISPYSRPGAFHRFTNTTDVLATIEGTLGLESLSQFDRFGRPLTDVWATTPDLRPFDALTPSVNLAERNPRGTRGALNSRQLNLAREDASGDDEFNRILWRAVKGEHAPYPGAARMPLLEMRRR